MNKAEINLSSYNNVESFSNFIDNDQVKKYREHKLKEALRAVGFIKKVLSENALKNGIRVLEIGSGNSKLLFQLSLQKLLKQGYGIEVSKSRYEFAEKWKKDLKIINVENINADILDTNLEQFAEIDLLVCIDTALQFLEPIRKNSVNELFSRLSKILSNNGCIVLELWSMNNILKNIYANNGLYKTWTKFGDSDPFSYAIESIELDDENYIVWNKHFISTHGKTNDNRYVMTNILKPYSVKEIAKMLGDAGFSNVQIYKNFEFGLYDYNHDEYIVVAKR